MKTRELTGPTLSLWAARALGLTPIPNQPAGFFYWLDERSSIVSGQFSPHDTWAHGGLVIEREQIELTNERDWREDGSFGRVWEANNAAYGYMSGDTPLIAAMRSVVAAKYGERVPSEKVA